MWGGALSRARCAARGLQLPLPRLPAAEWGTHTMSAPIRRESGRADRRGTFELRQARRQRTGGAHARLRPCGVRVWNEPATGDIVILKPGTLDDPSWAVPVGNIWTGSAMPYAAIDPALVNFVGQPADRQPLYDAWSRATVG